MDKFKFTIIVVFSLIMITFFVGCNNENTPAYDYPTPSPGEYGPTNPPIITMAPWLGPTPIPK